MAVADAAVIPDTLDTLYATLSQWPRVGTPATQDGDFEIVKLPLDTPRIVPPSDAAAAARPQLEIRWPAMDQWDQLSVEGQMEEIHAARGIWKEHEKAETPAWRAVRAVELLSRWSMLKAFRNAGAKRLIDLHRKPGDNFIPKQIVDHLDKLPEGPDSTTGLSLLTVVVEAMPPEKVSFVENKPNLILSRSVAQVESTAERYYLRRFGTAVHQKPGGQILLGFAAEEERGPTFPANVWTMGLKDAERRGAVVPLELRIWVSAILHTPLHARHGYFPVQIDDLTLRKFLSWIYTGKEMPRPSRYWKRILAAREVINDTELPFEYPRGSGNLWARPVVTLANPLTRPGIDDPWPVTVHLPPGRGIGPPISFARLQYWSTRNAACYRALINLKYRWHIEGKRLMPAKGKEHWLQIYDPKAYEKQTDASAEAICYPPGTGARRRDQRVVDAWDALEKLVRAGDAVSAEGRLLPP